MLTLPPAEIVPAKVTSTPRILLMPDTPGWAFDRIAHQIKDHLGGEFTFDLLYMRDRGGLRETRINDPYDIVLLLWWPLLKRAQMLTPNAQRYAICRYDHWSPKKYGKWVEICNQADAVALSSLHMVNEYSGVTAPVYVCEDGVDLDFFQPSQYPQEGFVAGWCGKEHNQHCPGLKGVDMIREACQKPADEVGDGTATAAVLAWAVLREGIKQIAAGQNPQALRRGIEAAAARASDFIGGMSREVKGHEGVWVWGRRRRLAGGVRRAAARLVRREATDQFEACAWHCPEMNRLYLVESVHGSGGEITKGVVDSIVCHEEE